MLLTREPLRHQLGEDIDADKCKIFPDRSCVMQGTQLNKGWWSDAEKCGATFTLLADDLIRFDPNFGELNVTAPLTAVLLIR